MKMWQIKLRRIDTMEIVRSAYFLEEMEWAAGSENGIAKNAKLDKATAGCRIRATKMSYWFVSDGSRHLGGFWTQFHATTLYQTYLFCIRVVRASEIPSSIRHSIILIISRFHMEMAPPLKWFKNSTLLCWWVYQSGRTVSTCTNNAIINKYVIVNLDVGYQCSAVPPIHSSFCRRRSCAMRFFPRRIEQ